MTEEATTGDGGTPAADNATDNTQPDQTLMTGDDTNAGGGAANDGDDNTTDEPSAGDDKAGTKDGEGDDDNQDSQASDTPTEYSEFTMPEGFQVNEEVMGEFTGLLGEIEQSTGQALPQEAAQKFVDMGGRLVQEGVEMAVQHAADFHAQRTQEWIDTFQQDSELGGTEEQQQQSLSEAKRVAQALGGDALIQAIDDTGAGNHPEIIRAFFKLKDVIGEDGKVIVANSGGGETNLAQRIYPNQQT